jgi:hypothetical protein
MDILSAIHLNRRKAKQLSTRPIRDYRYLDRTRVVKTPKYRVVL